MKRIGSDIGGVICGGSSKDEAGDTDTSFFGPNYLLTPEVPEAFAMLQLLAKETRGPKGECRVFLVSKCGPSVQEKTLHWLRQRQFTARTDIPIENVHFCRRRQDKAPIAATLGLSHFIDDRLEVLSHMTNVPHLILFRPDSQEVRRFERHLTGVRIAEAWPDIANFILERR